MKENFELFLNAVHYMIYKEEVWSSKKIEMFLKSLFSFIPKYLFTPRMKIRFFRRQIRTRKETNEYMYGKHYGQSISMAHHLFGAFYSGYPMLLSFIIIGFIIRYCKEGHDIAIFMASFIPIEICYIPAYNAVFAKDRYLKYFKQFEKQDEHWHKRWKRITLLFCIGSVLMFFISLGVVTLILS